MRRVPRTSQRQTSSRKDQEALVWQLDGLVANTMHSVQLIENKLTHEEQQFVLGCIASAKRRAAKAGCPT